MKSIIGKLRIPAMVVMAFSIVSVNGAASTVEWKVTQTLDLKTAPVDVAVSPDWQKLFVLTEGGDIQIYSGNGILIDTITVGTHVDKITAGPQGSVLILKSSQDKKVQIVSLDFIQSINVSGSPYKGVDDAPVVVAVFSDFE
jgi:DNA-binding beta-propeller fold protein YncE